MFCFCNSSVTLLASCVMKLQEFPLDAQTCHLKIGSCKYAVSFKYYYGISVDVVVNILSQ